MSRKKVAAVERGEPAMRRLAEALARPPASVCWTAALLALDYGLNLSDQADLQDVQWTVGRWQLGLNLTAICLAKTPKLRGYFRDRDDLIRAWLEYRAFESRGVELAEHELYVWTPRGHRFGAPGLSDPRWTPEEIHDYFPQALKQAREHPAVHNRRRPRWVAALADECSVSEPTMQRYLDRDPELRQLLDQARVSEGRIGLIGEQDAQGG